MIVRELRLPASEPVFAKRGDLAFFQQLGVKVDLTGISSAAYFAWLDQAKRRIPELVPGAEIAEKPDARVCPVLNTGIYYDTLDYQIVSTGAFLRTTSAITHAFCAFKRPRDEHDVRTDHRYYFQGREKHALQCAPTSAEAVAVVKRLLARTDIEHPGTFLYRYCGIRPTELEPAIIIKRYISTFYVWIDKRDALRCPMDRVYVADLRMPPGDRHLRGFREVELVIYPRIAADVARDPRVVELIECLARLLREDLGAQTTNDIKYQRGIGALGIHHD